MASSCTSYEGGNGAWDIFLELAIRGVLLNFKKWSLPSFNPKSLSLLLARSSCSLPYWFLEPDQVWKQASSFCPPPRCQICCNDWKSTGTEWFCYPCWIASQESDGSKRIVSRCSCTEDLQCCLRVSQDTYSFLWKRHNTRKHSLYSDQLSVKTWGRTTRYEMPFIKLRTEVTCSRYALSQIHWSILLRLQLLIIQDDHFL